MKTEIEAFRQYLMELELSENTIDTYIRSVRIFFCQYSELCKENMLDFKWKQMELWKPRTVNSRIVAMNRFCAFIGHPEYCMKGIRIHQNSTMENIISLAEYRQLLNGLWKDGNERGYWLLRFLAHTGARVSEFSRLTKDGLATGYCEMWTKGKMRRIYIPDALIRESRTYFQQYFQNTGSRFLFTNCQGGPLTSRGIRADIRSWAERYGIRKEVAHPHAFRHLFAIEFLKRNNNIALLADLLGHSSVSTTSVYLKLTKEEQMRQFNDASDW